MNLWSNIIDNEYKSRTPSISSSKIPQGFDVASGRFTTKDNTTAIEDLPRNQSYRRFLKDDFYGVFRDDQ